MKADYDANPTAPATLGGVWFKLAKTNAECGCRYLDGGVWGTLMYQMTGDHRYVDLAWNKLQWFLTAPNVGADANDVREMAAEWVLMYDWLYPGLTPDQRALFLSRLNLMFTTAFARNPTDPYRHEDSDQVIGTYFGVAFLYLATADHNPAATDFFNRAFVGGLAATGDDRSTFRNAIKNFVTMADGGEWIESSEYNTGTTKLLMMGVEGVRSATGTDYFPEVTAFLKRFAARPVYFATPDLSQSYQWGDDENPRAYRERLFDLETTNGMLAGLTQDDPAIGPYIQDFTYKLVENYGAVGSNSAEPWNRIFYFFNPYATRANYQTMPRSWFAGGQGFMFLRDGWDSGASWFGAHMRPRQAFIDHQIEYFGDFQLYRHGQWAFTHPISYLGPPNYGDGVNSMLIAGLSSVHEYRAVLAHEFGANGEYAYVSGTLGGQSYEEGVYWAPPPTFLHEWTRSLVYLPGADRKSDTVVIYDRVNAKDPQSLPSLDRYRTDDLQRITAAPALKQLFLHMPQQPALTPTTISWTAPANQNVVVSTLLPANQVRRVVDETGPWGALIRPEERKWQVAIQPAVTQQWDTFLTVAQVADAGVQMTNTLVRSVDGAEGVVLQRTGNNNVLMLFNSVQGPDVLQPDLVSDYSKYRPEVAQILSAVRLRTQGYTASWQATTSSTNLMLFDLQADLGWTVRVDGSVAQALAVSTQGVGRLSVAGAGAHNIQVIRSTQSPPRAPTTPKIIR